MKFEAFGLRKPGSPEKDEYIFPQTGQDGVIQREELDGSFVWTLRGTSLRILQQIKRNGSFEEAGILKDTDYDIRLTNSRLTFCCRTPDEKNWSSNLRDVAWNGFSAMVRKQVIKGKILLGQIRYEWIGMLGYQLKGINAGDTILLLYKDSDETIWRMELMLDPAQDGKKAANEILHRAVIYRRCMSDDKNDKELVFNNIYSHQDEVIIEQDDPQKNFSWIKFPTQFPAPAGQDFRPSADILEKQIDAMEKGAVQNAVRFCSYCGSLLAPGAKVCASCGKQVLNWKAQER